jgi:hypothetical protein
VADVSCEGYCDVGPPTCSGCAPATVLELPALELPAQRWPADDLEHEHDPAAPYLNCPGCIASGVMLCPGCFTPGPGANGLGRHTRCVGVGRWLVFFLYCALALGVLVAAVAFAVRFRTAALTGASVGLISALCWPYRCYLHRLAAVFTR